MKVNVTIGPSCTFSTKGGRKQRIPAVSALLCLSLLNLDVGQAEPATGCVGQGPRRRTRAVLLVDMLTSTCLLRARSVPDQRSRDSKRRPLDLRPIIRL